MSFSAHEIDHIDEILRFSEATSTSLGELYLVINAFKYGIVEMGFNKVNDTTPVRPQRVSEFHERAYFRLFRFGTPLPQKS